MNSSASPVHWAATFSGLLSLMRPKQWIKNGFVLAPLIFTGQFTDSASIYAALLAALLFCLASSATYIVNDYRDIEQDRKHPVKAKERPLASGQVSKTEALALLLLLYGILLWAYTVQPAVILVILSYLVLNIAYTFALKHQPVIDIFTIAFGFVLRVYAGAVALSVPLSSWMFVTSLCLALFLAAVKRKQELSHRGSDGRKVLAQYTVVLVDRYAAMSATGALMFYSLYVMSAYPEELVFTIPLVLFGLFRYWFIVETLDGGESPTTTLLKDWQLLLTILVWVLCCIWALWPEVN